MPSFMPSIRLGPSRREPERSAAETEIADLNHSLHVLAAIFPNISPEALRETLQSFSGQSSLQIAIEQLLKNQDKWVRGRWRIVTDVDSVPEEGGYVTASLISAKDEFRRLHYRWAVYVLLCQEFKSLNRSTIKGVLAEANHSYSQSRTTLQNLASRSWRSTWSTIWSRWQKPAEATKLHFMITWQKNEKCPPKTLPALRDSGDAELDAELYREVLVPFIRAVKQEQETSDFEMAIRINDEEANEARAFYECQCCFMDTTFEQMAACTSEAHALCYNCVRRSVAESLYGQGWGRNIDKTQDLMKCFAPSSHEACDGFVPNYLVERALLQSKGGSETWHVFETRLTEQIIAKTQLPLVKCPFCPYAEVDDLYTPRSMISYRPNTRNRVRFVINLIITLNFVPLMLLYALLCQLTMFSTFPRLTKLISISTGRLVRPAYLSRRFKCRSRMCGLASCLNCAKPWRDPHVCHESAALSLRATIETARTAALKRTCPRCNLGFIKDSGCNKLTCVCGYSMCYICRQGLGRGDGGEGYRHFCQHFRPMGGACEGCDKCDLYKTLDEDTAVMTAGIEAEKQWREKEGMVGVDGIGGSQLGPGPRRTWTVQKWSLQALADWWVVEMMTC